jgi:hypothetical protein
MQNVMRIINKYGKGILTYEQAVTMLRGGYGLTDTDIDMMLGESTMDEFAVDSKDWKKHLEIAATFGIDEDSVTIVKVVRQHFNSVVEAEQFVEKELLENKILKILQETPDISLENIAKALREKLEYIDEIILGLLAAGLIVTTQKDGQILRTPTAKGTDGITPQGKIPSITTMYRYALRAPFEEDGKSREFCQKMMQRKKLYSKQDIDRMSAIFGYDVWRMKGGWYTVPDTAGLLHVPYCRHTWEQVLIIDK